MKKTGAKMSLNKRTISTLSSGEMTNVKGGFTYSLSLGETCQHSKKIGAKRNAYQCGQADALLKSIQGSN